VAGISNERVGYNPNPGSDSLGAHLTHNLGEPGQWPVHPKPAQKSIGRVFTSASHKKFSLQISRLQERGINLHIRPSRLHPLNPQGRETTNVSQKAKGPKPAVVGSPHCHALTYPSHGIPPLETPLRRRYHRNRTEHRADIRHGQGRGRSSRG